MSPLVSGFFWDDFWSASGGWPDARPNVSQDIGLTDPQRAFITDAYNANMDALRNATLAAGKFSWQMLWTCGAPDEIGSTCPVTVYSALQGPPRCGRCLDYAGQMLCPLDRGENGGETAGRAAATQALPDMDGRRAALA